MATLTSIRGQETKTFVQAATFGAAKATNARPSNGYNLPHNGESVSNVAESVNITPVSSTHVNALNASVQKTADIDATAGVHNANLSYNPITDQFKVCEGSYVL